jgi:hypothetical protein
MTSRCMYRAVDAVEADVGDRRVRVKLLSFDYAREEHFPPILRLRRRSSGIVCHYNVAQIDQNWMKHELRHQDIVTGPALQRHSQRLDICVVRGEALHTDLINKKRKLNTQLIDIDKSNFCEHPYPPHQPPKCLRKAEELFEPPMHCRYEYAGLILFNLLL